MQNNEVGGTDTDLFKDAAESGEPLPPVIKPKKKKTNFQKKNIRTNIFIACMLAYPVLQFAVMWAFVNFNSILMTFQKYDSSGDGWYWVGFDNFTQWFDNFRVDPKYTTMLVNSLLHSGVGMFIIFPLCLITSYFLCRKIPLSGFFRVVFYLPSIIPLMVLVLGFTNMIDVRGLLGKLYESSGNTAPTLLVAPKVRWTVYLFTIWAGIGGNMLLLSGTIKRVPTEVLESAHLDGVGIFGELFRIVIPMIWPTLVTMFVMSMMGVFSVVFQPFFISEGYVDDTMTIGLWIFSRSSSNATSVMAATLGIICTIVFAPIVLLTRWGLDKCFANIDY